MNKLAELIIKVLAIFLVSIGVANLARLIFWLPTDTTRHLLIGIFILLICVFIIGTKSERPKTRSYFLFSFIPLLLLGFWSYFIGEFGSFDWSSIVFHFSAGLGDSGTVDFYYQKAMNAFKAILFISFGMLVMKNYISWFSKFDRVLAVLVLFINPALVSAATSLVSMNSVEFDNKLTEHYSVPKVVNLHTEKPKNFIHIYLESTESTYKNEQVFGPIMRPLIAYENKGFSASQIKQVQDTGWSAAGITASYCGVPLSPMGLATRSNFGAISSFMPNATCLGDVLKSKGYSLTYLSGADIESAAFDKILGEHGFENLIDFPKLLERYPNEAKSIIKDGRTSFGSNDDITFKAAYEILQEKTKKGIPYGITIMTNGGHAPYGNFSTACKNNRDIDPKAKKSLRAIHCTNLLTQSFIENAKRDGLLENTIVIVQSDHYSMRNEVFKDLLSQERSNLFFVYGEGIEQKTNSNLASMFDVYPTILEVLGFSLEDNKAGLGVSLLSDKPNLVQQNGLSNFDAMISNDYKLRYTLWASENNNLQDYVSSLD